MISQQDIKSYEFENIEQYYEYIVDSIINGQKPQARQLIKDMSKAQQKDALNYINQVGSDAEHYEEAKQMIIEAL